METNHNRRISLDLSGVTRTQDRIDAAVRELQRNGIPSKEINEFLAQVHPLNPMATELAIKREFNNPHF